MSKRLLAKIESNASGAYRWLVTAGAMVVVLYSLASGYHGFRQFQIAAADPPPSPQSGTLKSEGCHFIETQNGAMRISRDFELQLTGFGRQDCFAYLSVAVTSELSVRNLLVIPMGNPDTAVAWVGELLGQFLMGPKFKSGVGVRVWEEANRSEHERTVWTFVKEPEAAIGKKLEPGSYRLMMKSSKVQANVQGRLVLDPVAPVKTGPTKTERTSLLWRTEPLVRANEHRRHRAAEKLGVVGE